MSVITRMSPRRKPGATQQQRRLGDAAIGAAAALGHDVRMQRVQIQRDVREVLGQRGDGERIARVDHQRDLPAAAPPQDLGDFGARALQPRRRQIGGEHALRQIQRDHQRRAVFPQRLRRFAPTRPRQREKERRVSHRQRERREYAPEPMHPAAVGLRLSPCSRWPQQMRIDRVAPDALRAPPTPPPPQQRR
jgi:hypothetical protein